MSVDSKEMTNQISHFHESALRIVYDDYKSFQQPLSKDVSLTINQRKRISLLSL